MTAPIIASLEALPDAKLHGSEHQCRCPAHEDRVASLTWTISADGNVLMHCHAGCRNEDIVAAVGAEMRDLFEPKRSAAKPHVVSTDEHQVRDVDGNVVAIHLRPHLSDSTKGNMVWKQPDGTFGLNGTPAYALPLYGAHRLSEWSASAPIVVVEGEKATEALWAADIPAVGTVTGAASAPSVEVLRVLEGRSVILWADNDEPGRSHMRLIGDELTVLAAVGWVEWTDAPHKGDAADFLADDRDHDAVRGLLATATPYDADDRTVEQTTGRPSPEVTLVRLSEVRPERVTWLWTHRIPMAKVTVLDGDPGLGKSTVALDLASRVTTGRPMPQGDSARAPKGVLIMSAEDGLADTIQPRLVAAGAALERVVALTAVGDDLPSLPGDIAVMEQEIRANGVTLVVIDPLMAYLDPEVNSHRDQDIRRALAPLAEVAERTGAAILVIRHLNKSSSAQALYRGGGSIGIIGAARAALLAAIDPDDESRTILAVSKSNLGPKPAALAYRMDAIDEVARVDWLGATDHTASALLAAQEPSGGSRSEVAAFLRDVLADGRLLAVEVKRLTRVAGFSDRTVERAKKGAGVISQREGFGVGSKVYWAIDRHTSPGKSVAAYGDVWDPEAATDDDAEMREGSVLP